MFALPLLAYWILLCMREYLHGCPSHRHGVAQRPAVERPASTAVRAKRAGRTPVRSKRGLDGCLMPRRTPDTTKPQARSQACRTQGAVRLETDRTARRHRDERYRNPERGAPPRAIAQSAGFLGNAASRTPARP